MLRCLIKDYKIDSHSITVTILCHLIKKDSVTSLTRCPTSRWIYSWLLVSFVKKTGQECQKVTLYKMYNYGEEFQLVLLLREVANLNNLPGFPPTLPDILNSRKWHTSGCNNKNISDKMAYNGE